MSIKKLAQLKHETRYAKLSYLSVPRRTTLGRYQFWRHQSFGIWPRGRPAAYFDVLTSGKGWVDWTVEQYRLAYLGEGGEWWGWNAYLRDFVDDRNGFFIYFAWHGRDRLTELWRNASHN